MRIGIDARLYGISDRGIGRYTEKLIGYLEKIDFENDYFIFLREKGFKNYQPKNKNFHKVLANFRPYSLKEQIIFPFKLYKFNLDLVHFSHFNLPIFYRRPFVMTIHDLIISKFPESRRKVTTLPYFLYQIKLIIYQSILKNAVKSAKKIIAVSNSTKKDIINLLKIKPEKIFVTYEGVDKLEIGNWKLEIGSPYILYVGAAYPHKNLERLLMAFKNLKISDLKLILVGKKDFFYEWLEKYSQELDLADRVKFMGEVSDEELASLYQNAIFFIFPSLCEGFGLPGLEAMAYGLPVAASSVSSLPEILGQAAFYFNPYHLEEMEQVMFILSTNENLRKNLREKGLEQVKKYSWQKMAQETLDVYKGALSGK